MLGNEPEEIAKVPVGMRHHRRDTQAVALCVTDHRWIILSVVVRG
jgi:hypothetical protein